LMNNIPPRLNMFQKIYGGVKGHSYELMALD
jgi:hypothetical protein